MIWSDPVIQEATRNFVCATANCFFLNPPNYIKNLPDPKGTEVFQKFMKQAPRNPWPRPGTQQGVYIMSPDGDYLSGQFVSVTTMQTTTIMEDGLKVWLKKNRKMSEPVPTNHIRPVIGEKESKANLKMRVTYRDLPRGKTLRPGTRSFPNPYNLRWLDLKVKDAQSMVFHQDQSAWRTYVLKVMKDSVRGEMFNFNQSDWRGGNLNVKFAGNEGPYSVFRLNSDFNLRSNGRNVSFSAKVYGEIVFDNRTKEFAEFTMLAAGTRSGAGPSNGRHTDKGAAPIAVAVRINY